MNTHTNFNAAHVLRLITFIIITFNTSSLSLFIIFFNQTDMGCDYTIFFTPQVLSFFASTTLFSGLLLLILLPNILFLFFSDRSITSKIFFWMLLYYLYHLPWSNIFLDLGELIYPWKLCLSILLEDNDIIWHSF